VVLPSHAEVVMSEADSEEGEHVCALVCVCLPSTALLQGGKYLTLECMLEVFKLVLGGRRR
jgi:hypothetical protein